MAPTRERPGIVRVRISDREVWHVVDPSLTPAEAEEAVRAHRAANAPTNRSLVRRVLAWTPGVVALLVLGGAVWGTVVVMAELDLAELPGRIAVAVVLGGIGFVAAATAGIVLLEAPWRRDRVEAEAATSPHVVPIPGSVLGWAAAGGGADADAGTPAAADVWRVVAAVDVLSELEAAHWRLGDVLYWRLDDPDDDLDYGADDDLDYGTHAHGHGHGDDADAGPGDRHGTHPAVVALDEARLRASEELRVLGDEVGFPAATGVRPGTEGS
ncbi:hypothetical protein [Frigoribacterium sp. VKM Ac-2530]|uniref:hypothetical protein n=1 Tax=Frigoribacterium sp. VKM Ac-2530 TaxID=2783822 RepID=UPI00188BF680|nr:hypothetical protein [Frigoribacterium sp. VKM Ac-2530]MBF4579635.1 hypothetical protein [Frigoribacterium sp. VKM Ac-2530]